MSHPLSETPQEGHSKDINEFSETRTNCSAHRSTPVGSLSSGLSEKNLNTAACEMTGSRFQEWQSTSSIDVANERSFKVSHMTGLNGSLDIAGQSKVGTFCYEDVHALNLGNEPSLSKKSSFTHIHIPPCPAEEECEENKGFLLSSPPSITDPPDESPKPLKFQVSSNSLYRIFTPRLFRKLGNNAPITMTTPGETGAIQSVSPDARAPNLSMDSKDVPEPRESEIKRLPSEYDVQDSANDNSLYHSYGPLLDPLPGAESSCDEDGSWTPVTSPRAATAPVEWSGRSVLRTVGSHFSTSSVRSLPRSPRNYRRDGNGGRSRRHISVSPGPRQRIPRPRRKSRGRRPLALGLSSQNDMN